MVRSVRLKAFVNYLDRHVKQVVVVTVDDAESGIQILARHQWKRQIGAAEKRNQIADAMCGQVRPL